MTILVISFVHFKFWPCYVFYLYFKFKIPSEFLVDEDETVERETLNSVRKLFSAGCLDPTPFGTKSFAEITADCWYHGR